MDGSHHMASTVTVTELDLSACHPNTIVDRINAVPGLKTSTAFFTFLRANLVLPHSAMSSNVSTPYLEPQHTSQTGLPPLSSPSPLAATAPLTALDDIPPLSLDVLIKHDDKVDALKLVADSVAQQRQQTALNLVFHPLLLSALLALLAGVYQYAWVRRHQDLGTTLTLGSGAVMSYLLAIRYFASRYIEVAEHLKWAWLVSEDTGEEDVVIGTRFGQELIGALVLRLEPPAGSPAGGAKRKNRGGSLKGGKGVIRAWTTKLKYRHKGVGGDMLQEAVRITKERCGRDADVGFAKEHANSVMVLPEFFNGPWRKLEMKAARALEKVLSETADKKRR
ncbi:acetyltransferase [Apodospora peruviana]|uniref:Acetyltransferase n=1 Tax=Apodospora peruviana TaxID=516989 RepID=A0AAE0I4Z2_9PEZI|nr:acetyltransferase [Apodospora peruviana]